MEKEEKAVCLNCWYFGFLLQQLTPGASSYTHPGTVLGREGAWKRGRRWDGCRMRWGSNTSVVNYSATDTVIPFPVAVLSWLLLTENSQGSATRVRLQPTLWRLLERKIVLRKGKMSLRERPPCQSPANLGEKPNTSETIKSVIKLVAISPSIFQTNCSFISRGTGKNNDNSSSSFHQSMSTAIIVIATVCWNRVQSALPKWSTLIVLCCMISILG